MTLPEAGDRPGKAVPTVRLADTFVRGKGDLFAFTFTITDKEMTVSDFKGTKVNDGARKVLKLIDVLDDCDDVQNVYANFDVPDDIMQLIDA